MTTRAARSVRTCDHAASCGPDGPTGRGITSPVVGAGQAMMRINRSVSTYATISTMRSSRIVVTKQYVWS